MPYIGIDRGIVNHWIYEDAEYFKVWFEIIYRARFSNEPERKMIEGKLVTIEYGQFIFGRTSWSIRLKISEQRLRTLFKKLQNDEMIELIQKFPKFTLYSVKNYEKYNQQSNQQIFQAWQEVAASYHQQDNNTPTSNQPAANQQLTTQEERRKKDNNVNKVKELKTYSENTVDLTNHLIFWLKQNNPNAKIPTNLDKWNDAMDKLERIDNYEYIHIRSVIDWCQQDSFWKGNILSASKLREKIGTLVMQMQRPKGGTGGKISAFAKLQQMAREEEQREASGNY